MRPAHVVLALCELPTRVRNRLMLGRSDVMDRRSQNGANETQAGHGGIPLLTSSARARIDGGMVRPSLNEPQTFRRKGFSGMLIPRGRAPQG